MISPNAAKRKRARKRQSIALRDALIEDVQTPTTKSAWKVGWHAGKLFKLRLLREDLNR